MFCWTIKPDGKIERGVKASVYPTNPPATGLITTAEIEVETAACLDGDKLRELVKDDEQAAYAFVLIFLHQVTPKRNDKRFCYIGVDLNDWWPSAPHGDESHLLCYGEGSHALFKCQPGTTYIMSHSLKKVVVVQPDCKPAAVDASTLNQRIQAVLETSRRVRRDAGQSVLLEL